LNVAVGDGGDAHSGNAVLDLIGEALAHKAGADNPNTDRLPERVAFL
jgi:hypothetical protein